MDSIQATQNKGQFPSEAIGYSITDHQAIWEIPRGQIGVPESELLEHL